ncbi:MAG: membrane-bound lytic murein transglycosylase MltF [Burkholderiales bacterium]|jgi:membrane-bound lytic murein transglycosylase F|nr:membrane-bound lytic murein transglycosylase MltF [Burkholderiales bacterium]
MSKLTFFQRRQRVLWNNRFRVGIRSVLRFGRYLLLLPVLALLACDRPPTPPSSLFLAEAQAATSRNDSPAFSVLTVAFCSDPASWFVSGDGEFAGFEYDLLKQFTQEVRLELRPTSARNSVDLRTSLKKSRASLSAGLYRPNEDNDDSIVWTDSFYTAEPIVVYNTDIRRPKNWEQITGDTVAYLENSGMDSLVATLSETHSGIHWKPVAAPSADALLSLVDEGVYPYALVTSHKAALARNIYLNFAIAFSTGAKIEMAWALPAKKHYLLDSLNSFIDRAKEDGLIDRLAERYFHPLQQVPRFDAGVFQERIRNDLPLLRSMFHRAQEETGVEWRLLAAVAYQESQWDPFATSETGVRGFMQITENTARHLGVKNRLDPDESVQAAAGYLRNLKERLPDSIAEPDRTWMALASYNIGFGHLEDARRLARERNLDPNSWKDIKQTLPLLTQPEYYSRARYGYARGGMPVAFVDRVRAYYDILLRHEPEHGLLRLRAVNDSNFRTPTAAAETLSKT